MTDSVILNAGQHTADRRPAGYVKVVTHEAAADRGLMDTAGMDR
jgi:hypothetical protein